MRLHHPTPSVSSSGGFRRLLRAIADWHRRNVQYRALAQLDDRTLADIGLRRAEIGSMVAELAGRVEPTRRQRGSLSGLAPAANSASAEPAEAAASLARRKAA